MKIEVSNTDLAAGLKAVLPFAGKDKTLPMLSTVQLSVRDGALFMATTDRYMLGTYRIAGSEPYPAEFAVLIDTDTASQIAKLAGSVNFTYPVTLEVDGNRFTAECVGSRLSFMVANYSFPDLFRLLADMVRNVGEADSADVFRAFNADHLAKFAKVEKRNAAMNVWSVAGNKPSIVTVGDSFVGAIMPHRVPEGRSLPHWLSEPRVTAVAS